MARRQRRLSPHQVVAKAPRRSSRQRANRARRHRLLGRRPHRRLSRWPALRQALSSERPVKFEAGKSRRWCSACGTRRRGETRFWPDASSGPACTTGRFRPRKSPTSAGAAGSVVSEAELVAPCRASGARADASLQAQLQAARRAAQDLFATASALPSRRSSRDGDAPAGPRQRRRSRARWCLPGGIARSTASQPDFGLAADAAGCRAPQRSWPPGLPARRIRCSPGRSSIACGTTISAAG